MPNGGSVEQRPYGERPTTTPPTAASVPRQFFAVDESPENEEKLAQTVFALNLPASANKTFLESIFGADAIENVDFRQQTLTSTQAQVILVHSSSRL